MMSYVLYPSKEEGDKLHYGTTEKKKEIHEGGEQIYIVSPWHITYF